jgi:predicted AlkP superfamily phosphohydrolase/phosphomutase
MKLMSSSDIKAKTVWQVLGDQGHQVCVVNVPTEYPPRPVNGSLVCGALTPDTTSDFTYPGELKDEILQVVPHYKCEIDYAHLSMDSMSKQIVRSIENREKLIRHLLVHKEWDLFFAVFTETDLAQHKFWAGIDPNHPGHHKYGREFGGFIYQVYELLDKAVGRILSDIPKDTVVFIVSDHGFGPFYQSFSVSRWLANRGLLVLTSTWHRRFAKWLIDKSRLTDHAAQFREQATNLLCTMRGRRDVRALREKDVVTSARMTSDIDWSRTRAYFTADYGVRLNLRGREPFGIVAPGDEEESLKRSIIDGLGRLRYSNMKPVFEAVLPREDAYHGPYLENAADIIVSIDYGNAPSSTETWEYTLTHPTLQGTHTPFGILIAHGPGIKRSQRIQNAEIIDVAPTILYVFQEPLTTDMDGAVLLDLFEPSFTGGRNVKRHGSSFDCSRGQSVSFRDSDNGIKERLRALGYID